jgi:hypothetical protein
MIEKTMYKTIIIGNAATLNKSNKSNAVIMNKNLVLLCFHLKSLNLNEKSGSSTDWH